MSSDLKLRFLRFVVVGSLATVLHVVVYLAQVDGLGVDPVVAVVPAFMTAAIASYAGHHVWTFGANGAHSTLLPKFLVVALFGLGLNAAITALMVSIAGLWYVWALAVCVTLVPVVTFGLNQVWVFSTATKAFSPRRSP